MDAAIPADAAAVAVQRYIGCVKKLIPGSSSRPAHGFIECPDTLRLFGRDVFLHDQLAGSLTVGQAVSFSVALNVKGMPQAVEVAVDDGMSQMSQWPAQRGAGGGGMAPGMQATGQHSGQLTGERLCDLLMPEVGPALRGGRTRNVAAALLAAAELLGVMDELQSQMAMALSQQNGAFGGYGWQQPQGDGGQGSWRGGGGGGGKRQRDGPYGGGASMGNSAFGAFEADTTFEGVVKNIAPKGGNTVESSYGFVQCEDTQKIFGRDVYLHSNQAAELEVGSRVRFNVDLNKRGMPQAHNVALVT